MLSYMTTPVKNNPPIAPGSPADQKSGTTTRSSGTGYGVWELGNRIAALSGNAVYQPECSNECQKRQVVYYRELGKNRMRAPFRKWLTLLCSLLVLGVLVASGSRVLDKWISILVWSACLIGSVILLIKYARRPPENRGFYFGQAALLPRGWQRWLAGEEGTPKTEDHRSAGKPDRERQ